MFRGSAVVGKGVLCSVLGHMHGDGVEQGVECAEEDETRHDDS